MLVQAIEPDAATEFGAHMWVVMYLSPSTHTEESFMEVLAAFLEYNLYKVVFMTILRLR